MNDERATIHARLSQVGLIITDIDVAREFYGEKVGLPVLYSLPTMLIFDLDGASLLLSLPEDEVSHSAQGAVVYLGVEEIDATREGMSSRGVPFVDEPHVVHRTAESELWMTFFRDPDGHLLALTSRVPK